MTEGEREDDAPTGADERAADDLLSLLREELPLDPEAVRVLFDERHGVFRLEGRVPDSQTRRCAGEIARDFGRAKRVENRLRVEPDAPERGGGARERG